MKIKITLLTLALLAVCMVSLMAQTKVACVGNSTTYGTSIGGRELNSYPAQLQTYLGDDYIVANFGASTATAHTNGASSYSSSSEYSESLKFNPNVVLIDLGMNDSKTTISIDSYKKDYQTIIDSYKKLKSQPRIVLVTPTRSYNTQEEMISDADIQQKVRPIIEQLAYENNVEIFDAYSLFDKEHQAHLMPNKVHPSSIGAGIIAQNIYRMLTSERDAQFDIFKKLGSGKPFSFYGYKGQEYNSNGLSYMVVKPKIANKKHSWVLRARFWGHEPQLDIKLLELGFHIAYCDVANLYGAPSAVKRWDKFYKMMSQAGLNSKVVLEGMSRGGLVSYNWAVDNCDKVSAIYADAPVLDLKSWPMGMGDYEGSKECTDQMLEAYGTTSEQMLAYKANPIDHAAKIAAASIPVMHVVGDADKIVPLHENTTIFHERLKKANGTMELIVKNGVGHHPHSLYVPEPIIRFILKAEGIAENMCVRPVRGNEFRPGAGWYNGADWNLTAQDITQTLAQNKVDILMLGNSITQGFAVNRKLVGSCAGNQELKAIFGDLSWESAGISGDRTQHLLWRIKNGSYNKAKPKYVTIAIGVNNVGDSDQQVYEGIMAVTDAALKEFPQAKIILFGMLPTAASEKRNQIFHSVIDKIGKTQLNSRVIFVDPRGRFADSSGKPIKSLYSPDQIHLVASGYKVWAELIVDTIKSL